MTLRYQATAESRQATFVARLKQSGFVRILEAHNGLSGLVVQTAQGQNPQGQPLEFDGLWVSSLTDSAARGIPDAEIVGNAERLELVREICAVTNKAVIVDGDTGGAAPQFEYFVQNLQRAGACAVVIEDKVFPKRNSLDEAADQHLEDPTLFAQKIRRGKAVANENFLIVARLESLIAGSTVEDALDRARRYIEAGADGILIHSKHRSPDEVFAFAEGYEKLCRSIGRRPYLFCVPTTYNLVAGAEFEARGFNVVIHANHLMRAALLAMSRAAQSILENDRSFEATAACSSVSELFAAVGYDELTQKDRDEERSRVPVIIAAHGPDGLVSPELPRALMPVGGRPILRHQLDSVRTAGISEVGVVTGFRGEAIKAAFQSDGLSFFDAGDDRIAPIVTAEPMMKHGFLLLDSNVLLTPAVVRELLRAQGAIVMAVSRVASVPHADEPARIYVGAPREARRRAKPQASFRVSRIERAHAPWLGSDEFAGAVHVSSDGAQILRKLYLDLCAHHVGPFRQARSAGEASLLDLVEECLDRGFEVRAVEISHGWVGIRTREDLAAADQLHPAAKRAKAG